MSRSGLPVRSGQGGVRAEHASGAAEGQAQEVRPSIQRLLDAMTGIPAFVRNGRLDVLAVNAMGRAG